MLLEISLLTCFQSNDDQSSKAIAYQIAFDLYDNGTQEFLAKVIKALPKKVEEIPEGDKENRAYHLCGLGICADSKSSN